MAIKAVVWGENIYEQTNKIVAGIYADGMHGAIVTALNAAEGIEATTATLQELEQGFGDAVLFARFLPGLKAMDATVHCIVERPLAVLFEALEGADWVGQGVSFHSKIDYWINMMDLAGIHFAKTKDVPASTKLNVPPASVTRF